MFEKNLQIAYLLDFYGPALSERKQAVLDAYYNRDLSLAEIAEQIGISRQGVRELIKKAEEELCFLEEKLGFAEQSEQMRDAAARIRTLLTHGDLPEGMERELAEVAQLLG